MTSITPDKACTLTGKQLIAGQWLMGDAGNFNAFAPKTGEYVLPDMSYAAQQQIEYALQQAQNTAITFAETSTQQRADFLICCADEMLALGDELLHRAMLETGYNKQRIITERTRCIDQLHLFAKLLLTGDYLDARINTALPERLPAPRPDIRFYQQALGPVVVFGASNFPLAYSVAGSDTVSALAAGCPVIVKGHNSHPGTCELVARAFANAVKKCQLPSGIFSMLLGEGYQIGQQLVSASAVKAVGFTGSTKGGIALTKVANERNEPIPVFAEMGSINPVILLPETLALSAKSIAEKYVIALTTASGQFCVNPGLVIAVDTPALELFIEEVNKHLLHVPAGVMLNNDIYQRYQESTAELSTLEQVQCIAKGKLPEQSLYGEVGGKGCFTQAQLYRTDAETFIKHKSLQEEVFGHAALLVSCRDTQQLERVISHLSGQLTGTIQASESELSQYPHLIQLLRQRVGRLVVNNFPVGVEVCEAMMHGGPFPASTDTRYTSVGTAAIERFLRPITFQNYPNSLLPDALKNNNPLQLNRLVNGVKTRASI